MFDYVPQKDADFNSWQANIVEITEPQVAVWGIVAADFAALKTAQTVWVNAYAKAEIKQDRTSADVQAKDDARAMYEKELRTFNNQWLANNRRVTNSDRERMGLTVKTDVRTPVPKPSTAPVGKIDFSTRLQHNIHYADQATPGRKAKPEGTHGCEVWIKIDGAAPVEPSDLAYIATATRSPYTTTFEGKNAGKTAYYWLRWVNKRGEHGPWSSAISATVAG
jgi:hypothetical protein